MLEWAGDHFGCLHDVRGAACGLPSKPNIRAETFNGREVQWCVADGPRFPIIKRAVVGAKKEFKPKCCWEKWIGTGRSRIKVRGQTHALAIKSPHFIAKGFVRRSKPELIVPDG